MSVMDDLVAFQVQLERRQHRALKELAEREGRSMGSLVRESVAAYLTSLPVEQDPAFAIIGMLDDHGERPHGDVGESHDAYLADPLVAEPRTGPDPRTDSEPRTRTEPPR